MPCLRPADPTGQDTVAHLVLLGKEQKTLWPAQYILALCVPFWVLSLHWLKLSFFFFQTSGGGEGGKRVEWQIMISLCLAFEKYLLVRRALSSIPFHFTNKLEIH